MPQRRDRSDLVGLLVVLALLASASAYFIADNVWPEHWTTSQGYKCRKNALGDIQWMNPHLAGADTWEPTEDDPDPLSLDDHVDSSICFD